MALRTVAIHKVGNRPNLWMGGDREMVMFSGLLAIVLIFSAQEWMAAAYGVGLWAAALFVFRLMAKSDPQMRHIYMRSRRYKGCHVYQDGRRLRGYFPAHSTPFRQNRREFK
ncbi:MAG: conjugal transfer protein TrbD [Syntrophobacteraceae bacterium]|jgi:type IV secretion system protein VirB3